MQAAVPVESRRVELPEKPAWWNPHAKTRGGSTVEECPCSAVQWSRVEVEQNLPAKTIPCRLCRSTRCNLRKHRTTVTRVTKGLGFKALHRNQFKSLLRFPPTKAAYTQYPPAFSHSLVLSLSPAPTILPTMLPFQRKKVDLSVSHRSYISRACTPTGADNPLHAISP